MVMLGWLLALGAGIGLFWATWWGLYGDRNAARRRCPQCWHDLSETPGLTCGECGFAAIEESELHRRRRRIGVSALAALALVAGIGTAHWHLGGGGWVQSLPNRALVALIPFVDGGSSAVHGEIALRARLGRFGADELDALLDRCLRGDRWARPGTPEWKLRYAAYVGWWRPVGIGSGEQRRRIAALPAVIELLAPDRFVEGIPNVVHLRLEHWWPAEYEVRIAIDADIPGFVPVVATRNANQQRGPLLPVVLPALAPDLDAVTVTVRLEQRGEPEGDDIDSAWRVVETQRIARDVRRVPLEGTFVPVDSPQMSEAIAGTFERGMRRWPRGERRFGVQFSPRTLDPTEFGAIAIGVRVEVLENGVPRRETALWWMDASADPWRVAWEIVHEDAAALDRADESGSWTLRITGDPAIAARAAFLERSPLAASPTIPYWAGVVERPLVINDGAGPAPRRFWQVTPEPPRAGTPPPSAPESPG